MSSLRPAHCETAKKVRRTAPRRHHVNGESKADESVEAEANDQVEEDDEIHIENSGDFGGAIKNASLS